MAAALPLLLLLGGCASDGGRPGASPTPRCPSSAPGGTAHPKPAETIGAGPPPPAPTRVDLTPGPHAGMETVHAVPVPGARYDAVQIRVFVDGCPRPFTDEGDELPDEVVTGLRTGDRLLVLARLDGEGGSSAEVASEQAVIR